MNKNTYTYIIYIYNHIYLYMTLHYMWFKSVGAIENRAERLEWSPTFAQNVWAKIWVSTTELGAVLCSPMWCQP